MRDARRRATRAAVPDKEERRPWRVRLAEALAVGDVPEAPRVLAEMRQRYPHPALAGCATDLSHRAARIPNGAARWEVGETIGSGTVAKGVDEVVNRRSKGGREMRWWRVRADGVVALRLATRNDEWDARRAAALAA